MGIELTDSVNYFPQKRICVNGGDILRGLRSDDDGFEGFNELYFSNIEPNFVKAWKMHLTATLNLMVIAGEVQFQYSHDGEIFQKKTLGPNNLERLVMPPKVWFGFKCMSRVPGMIASVSNILHDDNEIMRAPLDRFLVDWG